MVQMALNTGSLFQFYTGCKEQSPVILLEYTLRETIDPEKLQAALTRSIGVFSVYRVKLALNEKRQPVYEENELSPRVYAEDGKLHALGKESRGYLFRVSYAGRRICLSIHHMLTDFFGANEFLKYIMRCYLHQLDEGIDISENTISVDTDDLRDPYTLFGDISAAGYNVNDKWENELVIPSCIQYRRGEAQNVRRLVFPVEKILLAAKKTDSSVFPLLSWIMSNAAAKTYDAEDKIVVGRGAANYRTFYSSKTPFCFSFAFKMVLHPRERSMDLETQLTVQRFRMDLKLERKTMDREIALRREWARQMDGPIEEYVMNQEAMDQERREQEKRAAFFISYLGRMDLPDDIAKHVESCYFNSPTTRGPLMAVAYSWRGSMVMNVSEMACQKTIVPEIVNILEQYSVENSVKDLGERSYDYYPLEELITGGSVTQNSIP